MIKSAAKRTEEQSIFSAYVGLLCGDKLSEIQHVAANACAVDSSTHVFELDEVDADWSFAHSVAVESDVYDVEPPTLRPAGIRASDRITVVPAARVTTPCPAQLLHALVSESKS